MCSKLVCFVDEAWLSSFNCLQELAFAIREEKPVVVLVMDQESWELLTVPGGSHKAWDMNEWGVELNQYAGEEIVPGQAFNQDTLNALFSYLAGHQPLRVPQARGEPPEPQRSFQKPQISLSPSSPPLPAKP